MTTIWGTPTWIFLHTLAEKVNETFYNNHHKVINKHILNICNFLPCPECSKHASIYLKKYLINKISKKEDLKKLLLNFHNNVNSRKNKPQFSDLTIYKKKNLFISYKNFKTQYTKQRHGYNLFTHTFQRKNIIKSLEELFKLHKDKFIWN